ncbi:hypothetical protein NX059_006476 [Plenodomus lindquistii]|nr:hypothetical protein NX059_006476 [Plenodomus lindquistii]
MARSHPPSKPPKPQTPALPAPPIQTTLPFYTSLITLTTYAAIAISYLLPGLDPSAPSTLSTDNVRTIYTGLPDVDAMFKHIVVFFTNAIDWEKDAGKTLQFVYLLCYIAPIFLVWFVEGWRWGKRGSLVSRPTFLGVVLNFCTIGAFGPFVSVLDIWSSRNSSPADPRSYAVPKGFARAIGPAILVGHVLPTILMFIPGLAPVVKNDVILLWQFSALLITILIYLFADTSDETSDRHSLDYLPHLIRSYKMVFGFATAYHWLAGLFVFILGDQDPTLALDRLVLPLVDLPGTDPTSSPATGFIFIKYDAFFAFIGLIPYGLYSVYELRSQGLVTSKQACVACGVYLGSQVVVGPGAAIVGLWWWRENCMAVTNTKGSKN